MHTIEDGTNSTMKEHVLSIYAIERFPELPISEECYKNLYEAKERLSSALQIEILYDALVSSYIEWESTMLSEAVRCIVYSSNSYIDLVSFQTIIMRRLVTILTLSRQYQDQVKKHVKRITGVSAIKDVDAFFRNEETNSTEYQIIYYLRKATSNNTGFRLFF